MSGTASAAAGSGAAPDFDAPVTVQVEGVKGVAELLLADFDGREPSRRRRGRSGRALLGPRVGPLVG